VTKTETKTVKDEVKTEAKTEVKTEAKIEVKTDTPTETPKTKKGKKRSLEKGGAEKTEESPANPPSKKQKTGGGNFKCEPCSRSFTTEGALASHNKAKHK